MVCRLTNEQRKENAERLKKVQYKPNTLKQYGAQHKKFFIWCNQNEESHTVTAEKCQRFLFDSRKKKEEEKVLAQSLDRSKLSSGVLTSLCAALCAQGLVTHAWLGGVVSALISLQKLQARAQDTIVLDLRKDSQIDGMLIEAEKQGHTNILGARYVTAP
jgi:hypothetical protein